MAIYAEPGAGWPREGPSQPRASPAFSQPGRLAGPGLLPAVGLGGLEAQKGRGVTKGQDRRREKRSAARQLLFGGGATLGPPRRAGRRKTGGGDVSGSPTGLCPIPGERLRVSGGSPRLRLLPAPRSGGLPSPQAEGLHLSGFIQGGLPCSGEEAEGDPAKPPEAERMPKEGGGPAAGLPPAGPPQRKQQQHDRH